MGGAVVAGPAAGLLTAWLAAKLAAGTARSGDERRAIAAAFRSAFLFVLPMIGLILGLVWAGTTRFAEVPAFLAVTTTLWTVVLVGSLIGIAQRTERRIAALRAGSGVSDPAWAAELARRGVAPARARRYESRLRFLGLPLFAYASGGVDAGAAFDRSTRRGARGWIAVGDLALSPLLAMGGVAIAPVAIGGVTLGLLSLSIAGVAVGALAVGSLAFGWVAFGIVAVGFKGAGGVTAIAQDFAVGPQASALEANSAVAEAWFREAWVTPIAALFGAAVPVLVLLAIVIPLGLMARRAWTLRLRAPGSAATTAVRSAVALRTPIPQEERLHGLDLLRAGALLLGVVLHAAMPYVLPPGLWAIGTTTPVPFLGWLAYTLHSFRMEAFFLLAGFFGALVVARRGVVSYVADRFRRILLVFLVALVPMKLALAALWIAGGRATGWLTLPPEYAQRPWYELALGSLWIEKFPDVVLTHLWFLYYLSILTGLFLVGRAAFGRLGALGAAEGMGRLLSRALASRFAPLALALAVTPILAGMTGMDIDTPDRTLRWHPPLLALYGLFFALGWWLERHRAAFAPFVARWRTVPESRPGCEPGGFERRRSALFRDAVDAGQCGAAALDRVVRDFAHHGASRARQPGDRPALRREPVDAGARALERLVLPLPRPSAAGRRSAASGAPIRSPLVARGPARHRAHDGPAAGRRPHRRARNLARRLDQRTAKVGSRRHSEVWRSRLRHRAHHRRASASDLRESGARHKRSCCRRGESGVWRAACDAPR